MKYYAPKALSEAYKLMQELKGEKITILAGGTDVVPRMNCSPEKSGWINIEEVSIKPREEHIVFLGNLNLSYISEEENQIRIGACTTLSDLLASSIIESKVPVLKQTVSQTAGQTIRNVATLGGNVMNASPAADSVPTLMAIDTQLVLASIEGERVVSMTDFFKGPGETEIKANEILKEFIIPAYSGKAEFIKFGRRKAESLSVVNGAARIVMDGGKCVDVRIIVGSVASTPLRLLRLEERLKGEVITEEVIKSTAKYVSEIIAPIDDKRSTASYRKKLAVVLVERLLRLTCEV